MKNSFPYLIISTLFIFISSCGRHEAQINSHLMSMNDAEAEYQSFTRLMPRAVKAVGNFQGETISWKNIDGIEKKGEFIKTCFQRSLLVRNAPLPEGLSPIEYNNQARACAGGFILLVGYEQTLTPVNDEVSHVWETIVSILLSNATKI